MAEALIALAAAARRAGVVHLSAMDLWIGPETSIGRPIDVSGGPEPAPALAAPSRGASTPESGLPHPKPTLLIVALQARLVLRR